MFYYISYVHLMQHESVDLHSSFNILGNVYVMKMICIGHWHRYRHITALSNIAAKTASEYLNTFIIRSWYRMGSMPLLCAHRCCCIFSLSVFLAKISRSPLHTHSLTHSFTILISLTYKSSQWNISVFISLNCCNMMKWDCWHEK